ncbi:Ca2+-binding RTX toxin-like protein, partial [Hoeflea marina]
FDYETEASIDIVVTATSQDGSTSTQTFTLAVQNISDMAPTDITFTGGTLRETVVSGGSIDGAYDPSGSTVAVLSTTDADGPDDGFVYVITSDPSGHFEIVDNEIRVESGQSIDFESQTGFDVTVEVTDAGGFSHSETIRLTVEDYNGSFTAGNGGETATGTSEEDVLAGGAGNDVLGGGAGDDILLGNAGNDTLRGGAGDDAIHGAGEAPDVSMKSAGLDMASPSSYIVTPDGVSHSITRGYKVIVMDAAGNVTAEGQFDTYVDPANAAAMVNFLNGIADGSYVAIATFDEPRGNVSTNPTVVAALERVGVDATTIVNLEYRSAFSFYGHIDASGAATEIASAYQPKTGTPVYIDTDAGTDTVVYSGNLADYSVSDLGNGIYQVTDNRPGSPDGTDTLHGIESLQFADQTLTPYAALPNHAPTNITYTGGTVKETVISGGSIGSAYNASGVTVATLSTTDEDVGDTHTYTITSDPSGHFAIVGNQLQVKTGQTLDYETAPSHSVTVQTTDAHGATYSRVITINVTDYEGSYTAGNGGETITGTSEENTLTGGTGNDDIRGGVGNDAINAGAGNDKIRLQSGIDTINGGSGTDILDIWVDGGVTVNLATGQVSGSGLDGTTVTGIETVWGGIGNDTLIGSGSADTLYGFDGNDTISGGAGNDVLMGENGNDRLTGGAGNDDIQGGAGTDTVVYSGNRSDYSVRLAAGVYTVVDLRSTSPEGTDTVRTVENFEFADGTYTTATILGGAPTDMRFTPNAGLGNASSTITAGTVLFSVASVTDPDPGDRFTYSLVNNPYGAFTINAGTGAIAIGFDQGPVNSTSTVTVMATDNSGNTYQEVVNIYSGDGANSALTGSGTGFYVSAGGSDTITAGAGEDMIFSGTGNDNVSAGAGNDIVYMGDGNDRFDTQFGHADDDDGNDHIDGGAGVDDIWAGGGDDILVGGTGNDLLEGEAGNDTFLYNAGDGSDTVHGGLGWTDTIELQGMNGAIAINGQTVTGQGWTLELDSASTIDSQAGESLHFSADAHGTITFTDGAVMTFTGIEKLDW